MNADYTKEKKYQDNKTVLEKVSIKNDTTNEIILANYFKTESEKSYNKAIEKTNQANSTLNTTEKNNYTNEANKLFDDAINKQEKSLELFSKKPTDIINQKESEKPIVVAKQEQPVKINNQAQENKIKEETIKQKIIIPQKIIIAATDNKTYNGIIFKVQISAIRNEPPDDAFAGLTPISREITDNGLILFFFGIFIDYDDAVKAKNEARDLGFDDAFIVAFVNGKRIPLRDALDMLKENKEKISSDLTASVFNIDRTLIKVKPKENLPENTMPKVDGLYYTVQVGVLGRIVTADKLHNLNPLYYEKTAKGNFRYTCGVYNNFNDATKAKDAIVNKGIDDAFVVAFYKGRKLGIAEARNLISSKQAVATKNNIPINFNVTVAQNRTNEKPTIPVNKGVYYSVQVGVYAKKITSEKLFNIIPLYFDFTARGYYRYITTIYKTYNEAVNAKNTIVDKGVKDAFVVAFNNGKEISIKEARNLK